MKINAYSIDEQETLCSFDVENKRWFVCTNYGPDIRRYMPFFIKDDRYKEEYSDNNRLISIEGFLDPEKASVKISKKRQLTEEQRAAMAERFKNNLNKDEDDD